MMSKIDELYKFVNERNLEMHVFRKETHTRIIILLPAWRYAKLTTRTLTSAPGRLLSR